MTAVMTASGLGGPFGRLAVGPVYRAFGNAGVWIMVAAGLSVGAVLWIAAALRRQTDDVRGVAVGQS
jgi:hypothetical protein